MGSLKATGKTADALAAYRLARADQEALAAAPGASNDARCDLADTINRIGILLSEDGQAIGGGGRVPPGAGDPPEAGRRQPRRHRISSSLADSHNDLGWLWHDNLGGCANTGKPAEAEAEFRKALAIQQKLADDNPAVTDSPRPGISHNDPRLGCCEDGQAGGGGGRVPQGAGDPPEAGRRQPRRHRIPQQPGVQPLQPRHPAVETGKPAEAEAEYRKAMAIRQKLVDDNPSDIGFRDDLSYDYLRVAALQAWFGQDKELSSTCEKLLSLAKDTEDPTLAERRRSVAACARPTPSGAKPRWFSPVARWNMERVPSGWFISRWPSAWPNTGADTSRKPTPL